MTDLGWSLLLFISKWALMALVFAVLAVMLFSIRREMGLRIGGGQPKASVATGRLRVVQPGSDPRLAPGAILNLKADSRLGADPDNDVLLDSPFVSGHHARLSWDGAAWWVEDLGSRNGTYIEARPCPSHVPQQLTAGTPLKIGDTTFELVEAG